MGLFSDLFGIDDGSDDIKKALENAQNVPLPVLERLDPEMLQVVAEMNPEAVEGIRLGPSAMEGISLDPRYEQAQLNALNRLQDISNAGGRDAQFEADAARLQNDINSNLRGNEGAIMQNMAARGMGGGMGELVARQQAAQEAANRQSQMGMDLNAQAQQRALQALMGASDLGGQMANSSFGRQAQVAGAKDNIAQFNAQNLQSVNNMNTQARNNAQMANIQNRQNIANSNVGLRNNAQEYNKNLAQRNFDNQLGRTGMVNNALIGSAQNKRQNANEYGQDIGGIIRAGATWFGGGKKGG